MGALAGYTWQYTLDITQELASVEEETITTEQAGEIIAQRLMLTNFYPNDPELRDIIHGLNSLTQDSDVDDLYETVEWLKDWGDVRRKLFVLDFDEQGPVA